MQYKGDEIWRINAFLKKFTMKFEKFCDLFILEKNGFIHSNFKISN